MESTDIESIWLQLNFVHKSSSLLNFVYRPPNSPQSWIDAYEKQLTLAESTSYDWYAMGDYNIAFSTPNSFNNAKWSKTVQDFGLHQLIHSPTRVTKNSSTIIDHIYTTSTQNISEVIIPAIGISDHYPVTFTLSIKSVRSHSENHTSITYRSFKHFDENTFLQDVDRSNISILETVSDPNIALNIMYDILNSLLAKHAPLKSKRVKRIQQPGWYSDEVKQARNKRDHFKACQDWDQYKIWRNKCISIIRKSKKSFFNDAVKSKKDSKLLWQNIKTLSNDTNQPSTLPNSLLLGKQVIEGKQQVADALNRHFVNIANSLNKTAFDSTNFDNLKSYLDQKLLKTTFSIDFITSFEVSRLIDKLNVNKSCGIDRIGPNILKLCKTYLSQPLAALINNCISSGIFPDKLKLAGIIPLHKGGCKEDPNNYRPISLLPTLSKLIERHIANQMTEYFQTTNILNERQSGFRQHHSCQTALIRLVDSWLTAMDEGNVIGTVFLDFKKAFDLVDHKILLFKLKLYHFSDSTIQLFKSYLSNRKQLIRTDSVTSNTCSVTSGVPQGSILGPLLFLIYVNDLPLELLSETDMYADDTTLHNKGCNLSVIQSKLQSDLVTTQKWCQINNMAINPAKTTCMIIGSRQKLKFTKDLTLFVESAQIANVQSQKLLGIHIDKSLTWKIHIDKTCTKLVSKLFLLKRIQYFLTSDMKQLFYNAYITPIFDYGCVTWHKASAADINRIIKLQKRAARIVLNERRIARSSVMFKTLNWLTFTNRCKYFTALLVHKSLHNLTPTYINELIPFSRNIRYELRSKSRLDIAHIKANTNYLKKTFGYSSMEVWNQLPVDIRLLSNRNTFKTNLKTFLFSNLN